MEQNRPLKVLLSRDWHCFKFMSWAEPSNVSLCPQSFVLSGDVLAPVNVLAPQLRDLFLGLWGMLPPPFLSPLNSEGGFLFSSIGEYIYRHSMLTPHCKGLGKLSTLFSYKLDPADWPGASDGGCHVLVFFLKLEEREEEKREWGESLWTRYIPRSFLEKRATAHLILGLGAL